MINRTVYDEKNPAPFSRGVYAGRVLECQTSPTSAASNTTLPRSNSVKHPLKNTENDCHQWLSDSFRVH